MYEGRDDADKADYDQLRRRLLDAFSLNKFNAYQSFVSRRLNVGESVDVYVADLKRLASLVSSNLDESWIKCAFVSGLPEQIQAQLKAASSVEDMTLQKVIERSRTLAVVDGGYACAAVRKCSIYWSAHILLQLR